MKYFKYLLENDSLLPTVEEEENPINGHLSVLGNECTKEATFDAEGEVITEAEYSDKLLVDVIWNEEEDEAWTPFRVKPTSHQHWIGGDSGRKLWAQCNP
jgi:hypothetical protein